MSDINGGAEPDKPGPRSNSERLLTHLKDGSLAAQLVRAHGDRDPDQPEESMRAVLKERLEQERMGVDGTQD
jgi:hypothetical protein